MGQTLRIAAARGHASLVYGDAGELGQSMVQYAIIAALVAIVAMVAVQAFGVGIGQVFANMTAKVSGLGK